MHLRRALVAAIAAGALALIPAVAGAVGTDSLTPVSTDPYLHGPGQHRSEVEPDTFSWGRTVVSAFQVGRYPNGGAANIGWATSTDAGHSWKNGFLPGITIVAGGPFGRATDPSVAFDVRHRTWIVSYLVARSTSVSSAPDQWDVLASRSPDGLHWSRPVIVDLTAPGQDLDKNWIVCDNTSTSPHFGRCYTEFDAFGFGDLIYLTHSSDGGKTWSRPITTVGRARGLGGQPVVQPDGWVVMPYLASGRFAIESVVSLNGGVTLSAPVLVANIHAFFEPSLIRNPDLPSAEVDAHGRVYLAFSDCRFRPQCTANDVVITTSTNGLHWSALRPVPIAPGEGVDNFTPGLGVDRTSSGDHARLALTFYSYRNPSCRTADCTLRVGYVSSTDGGRHWSSTRWLSDPFHLTWLPLAGGFMYGDYISTSIIPGGPAVTVVAIAQPPSAGLLRVSMYAGSLSVRGR